MVVAFLDVIRSVRHVVERGVAQALPSLIARAMRRHLASLDARGPWHAVEPGTVLVANHHSWWDVYFAIYLSRRLGLPLVALMNEHRLAEFPFFAAHGAVPRTRPREMVRRVREGGLGIVFVEGTIRPAGPLGPTEPGAVRIADWAGAPIRPWAVRVAVRGGQRPEAFFDVGEVHEPGGSRRRETVEASLAHLVVRLDEAIASSDPERPVDGFDRWFHGRGSDHGRASRFATWWRA